MVRPAGPHVSAKATHSARMDAEFLSMKSASRIVSPLQLANRTVPTVRPNRHLPPGGETARGKAGITLERRGVSDGQRTGPAMIPAREALARLRDGNARFATDVRGSEYVSHTRRAELAVAQQPFAIILGCSDSRVPAEIVFDQGLGDLFVIRVAGNIVAPSQIGSVEFAAARFSTRLVVVLGHSQCGAILATLEELRTPTENQSRNLQAIVDRVRPSVEGLFATDLGKNPEALVQAAVRSNIRASVNQLRHGSQVLEDLIRDHGLLIVGAEYSLETGVVDFFDGVSGITQGAHGVVRDSSASRASEWLPR